MKILAPSLEVQIFVLLEMLLLLKPLLIVPNAPCKACRKNIFGLD